MPDAPAIAIGSKSMNTTSPRKINGRPALLPILALPHGRGNAMRPRRWGKVSRTPGPWAPLEFHHEAGAHDHFARAQIREPVTHVAIAGGRIGAAAHAACRCSVIAAGRRYAARSRPVGNARMAERRFRPPGYPVARHILEIDLRIPLIQFLSRLLSEVRRTAGRRRSIDGRGQGQIAAGVVHETAADRYRV